MLGASSMAASTDNEEAMESQLPAGMMVDLSGVYLTVKV